MRLHVVASVGRSLLWLIAFAATCGCLVLWDNIPMQSAIQQAAVSAQIAALLIAIYTLTRAATFVITDMERALKGEER